MGKEQLPGGTTTAYTARPDFPGSGKQVSQHSDGPSGSPITKAV